MDQRPYLAIAIDREVEASVWLKRNGSRWQQMLRKAQRYIPFRIYYEIPHGRASVERQLKMREHFAEAVWSSYRYPVNDIRLLAEIVAKEMRLPNCHLIPSDPLLLLLTPRFDDFAVEHLLLGIREALGVGIDRQQVSKLLSKEGATFGEFVENVLDNVPNAGSAMCG